MRSVVVLVLALVSTLSASSAEPGAVEDAVVDAALKAASMQVGIGFSGVVTEGETHSTQVEVPYAGSYGTLCVYMENPGGTTGRSSLKYILKINGFAVMDGTSSAITVPSGIIQQGTNTFAFEFVNDGDGTIETTSVLTTSYIKVTEKALPVGSFKERGQGPIVISEGNTLTFTVESLYACASLKMLIHSVDRGGVGNGRSSLPYIVYVDGVPVVKATTSITVPSGILQQGSNIITIAFQDDGDATAETTLVLEDSYLQVQAATLPLGSFIERGQGIRVINEGDSLTFTVDSPHLCAQAKVSIHTVDRGGFDNGLDYLPYIVYVNGAAVENGTTSVTVPSGVVQQGANTFTIVFQNDGDAKAETTLLLEDSYIQVFEKDVPDGSFKGRGRGPTVVHEGDTLTFTVNSPNVCTGGAVYVHSVDRGGIEYGRSYLTYILKINGLAVLDGTSAECAIPSGVIQKGNNTFVLEFQDDGDAYAETTLVLEDSFIQTEAAELPLGAFKDRAQGPAVFQEGNTLSFVLNLGDTAAPGTIKLHATDRGGVGNGTLTVKYNLNINGAASLTGKSLNSTYTIPVPAKAYLPGNNTFTITFVDDSDGKVETALLLEDSYLCFEDEIWPDADSDGVPDRIEGGAELDTDSDGTPNYLDPDSDDDDFIDGDEYRSGYDPYNADSIPADVILLQDTVSPSFWRDNTLDLLVAPVSFVVPGESAPVLPDFALDEVLIEPPTQGADVTFELVSDIEKPLSVVMLFDGSGSLDSTDPDDIRIAAGKAFVSQLGVGDETAVLEFCRLNSSSGLYWTAIHQTFTTDSSLLDTALDQLGDTGNTPLYQSTLETLDWFDVERPTDSWRRVIVLFSDGEPNTDTQREECIARAQELRIPIVTVGLGDAAEEGTGASEAMRTLAEETYGIYVAADSADALANIYGSLAEGLFGDAYRVRLVFDPKPVAGTNIHVTLVTNYGNEDYTFTVPGIPDNDGDGLLDNEEDLNANGVVDAGETDPFNRDSDNDGISDYEEIYVYHSDPTEPDSDNDGCDDDDEINWDTDPNNDEDLPPNLNTMTIGALTVEAEAFVNLGSNRWEARGYVRINQFLRFSGNLTLDFGAMTVSGSGEWFLRGIPYVPGGALDLYDGPLGIAADTAICNGLNAAASALEVVGLDVELESFHFITGGIQISGSLELPESIDISVEIDNLEITASSGIEFEGQINLPDVKFAGFPWGLEDAHLDINTFENEFGGGGTLNTPKFDVIIEQITIRDGELQTVILGIGFPEPGINLDSSGVVWLQSITGGLMDMAAGPPPLKIKAACELTIGPTVAGYRLITGVPELIYDTSGMFDATGTIYLFGGPDDGYEMAQVFAHFGTPGSADPGFAFGADAHLWAGVFEPSMSFRIDFDNHFEGTASGTFDLSQVDLAVLSETVGGLVETALEYLPAPTIDLTCTLNNDGFSGSFDLDVIAGDIDFTVGIEPGSWPSLDASFEPAIDIDLWPFKLDAASLAEFAKAYPGKSIAGEFVIPAGTGRVMVTLSYTEGISDFSLIDPESTVLTPGGADGTTYGYGANPNGGFAFYILNNPIPGTWQIDVPNPEELGDVSMQVLPINTPPTVAMVSAKSLSTPVGSFVLGFTAADPDDAATVSLHYDTNMEGFDGLTIVSGLAAANGYMEYTWDTTEVAPGQYYVYARIDDGVHAPQLAYLDQPVLVMHETAVPAPYGLTLNASGGAVTARWGVVKADVLSYRIYWLAGGAPWRQLNADAVGTATTYTMNLETGRTYRVWVTAVNPSGVESAPSAEKTITPLASGGANNPPHIVSTPVTSVAANTAYAYTLEAEDADSDTLTYTLTQAPAGMTIDAAGEIEWWAAENQRGTHTVTIQVKDADDATDTQTFTLAVTAPLAEDVDGDGLSTSEEVAHGTDANYWDTDEDGLSDGDEVNVYHTDPAVADTDGDGIDDGDEIASKTDPLSDSATQQGSLTVVIEPAGAQDSGAQWAVDGGAWRYSGERVDDLRVGPHTVTFKAVLGWLTPDDESVDVTFDAAAQVVGSYTSNPAGRGDVDLSGDVSAIDVQLVINCVLGLPIGSAICDINGDSSRDAIDVQLVINAALGLPIK